LPLSVLVDRPGPFAREMATARAENVWAETRSPSVTGMGAIAQLVTTVPMWASLKLPFASSQDLTPVSVNSPAEAYQRYGPALLRKAERVLRNEDDAMDIVQALFLDLISRPPNSLDLSYLYTAVTNRCLNLIRNESVRSRLLQDHAQDLCGAGRRALGESMLTLELVTRLVGELDQKSAEIVVYHFVDDLNQSEVAAQVGISRRAVVKRLGKIRDLARALDRKDLEELA
jgi:RNA polymerase sigma-70 factor (ECF subfamily)